MSQTSSEPRVSGSPVRALAELVEHGLSAVSRPARLLCCGQMGEALGRQWCDAHPDSSCSILAPDEATSAFPLTESVDLALIADLSEVGGPEAASLLLGQLRNYGTGRILVLATDGTSGDFSDFIGLGFRRHASFASQEPYAPGTTIYTYNIDTYNHRRKWNNPDHWANLELWGKAWW